MEGYKISLLSELHNSIVNSHYVEDKFDTENITESMIKNIIIRVSKENPLKLFYWYAIYQNSEELKMKVKKIMEEDNDK